MGALQDLTAKLVEARKQAREMAQGAFKEAFAEYLEKHPVVEGIKWNQYTPYFNDGEPCVFGRGEMRLSFVDLDEAGRALLDSDYGDGWFEGAKWRIEGEAKAEFNRRFGAAFDGLDALASVDRELYEAAFGDHVEVTVTRDGISVDEYSHD